MRADDDAGGIRRCGVDAAALPGHPLCRRTAGLAGRVASRAIPLQPTGTIAIHNPRRWLRGWTVGRLLGLLLMLEISILFL